MNAIDRLVTAVSPERGLRRRLARTALEATASGYSHGGASRTKTSLKGWKSDSRSPQSDIDKNLDTLRQRSRDLYYNAPVATSAINRNVVHVIGQGLAVAPKPAWRELGITRERADAVARDVKFHFDMWARSKGCDWTGQNDFYELQQIGLYTELMGGEFFAIPGYVPRRGPFELSVRLIEGDLCCNPGSSSRSTPPVSVRAENGNLIHNGVEVDASGRVVAYWFVSGFDDDFSRPRTWQRVPVEGDATGNPNVLHVFDAIRPTQYRGIPYLAPVIDSIKQLTRYEDAEIMAAVINGLFTVFITTEDSQPDLSGQGGDEGEPPLADDEIALGNGNITTLQPGESVNVVDAKRPNSNFDGFVSAMAKSIGAALDIPAELLLMQFTASYSASRGALLEAWSGFEMRRQWFANDFCQPIYELWLSEAVAKGYVDMPGFFADPVIRAAWSRASWTGPAPGQLNPTVEVAAAVAKMEAGLSTGEREAMAMNGSDYSENVEQLAAERELRREQGLEEEEAANAD